MESLLRHVRACNNVVLPGRRLPVLVGGEPVGWVLPALAEHAGRLGAQQTAAGLDVAPDLLPKLARALAERGLLPWRGESFDVRARPDGPVLAQIDRGALPRFGIAATGVHVNGMVGDRIWVARRARDKLLDPGKLDHLVAGGVASGSTPEETLVKEAGEEAGLTPALARRARPVGILTYAMEREEGLRRDVLHCFDLELPESFVPEAHDREVEAFELWELSRVVETVRDTDDFKFNVNLALIDLFLRRGLLGDGEAAAAIRAELYSDGGSGGAAAIGMSRDSPPGAG